MTVFVMILIILRVASIKKRKFNGIYFAAISIKNVVKSFLNPINFHMCHNNKNNNNNQ